MMENVTYVEDVQKEHSYSEIKTRQTLRTAEDLERERLGAHHVDEVALRILQVKQIDA